MECGKYIIVVNGAGVEAAVCFDNIITHADMGHNKTVVSAGFFAVGAKPSENDMGDIDVCVFGKSVGLGIVSRPTIDEKLIKRVLRKAYNY